MNFGIWISPYGHVIGLDSAYHIQTIISQPEAFGLTSDDISNTYNKYEEPVGKEGKARDELIKKVIKHGWIRVRMYRDYWSFTVDRLTDNTKSVIDNFFKNVIEGQYGVNRHMIPYNVNILEVQTDSLKKTTIHDITRTGLQEKVLLNGVHSINSVYEEIIAKNKQLLK